MNKAEILQLNAIPDGQEAWLTYEQYLELKRLFETVPVPTDEEVTDNLQYLDLYQFLTEVAGLKLPPNEAAIHFNAFALIRRGYQVESITGEEYTQLCKLMEGLEQPGIDDLELYDTGGHRQLYNYLTKTIGLTVQRGRGPAWYRARMLIDKYEADNSSPISSNKNRVSGI